MLIVSKWYPQEDLDFLNPDSIMINTFKNNRKRKTGNYGTKRWKIRHL